MAVRTTEAAVRKLIDTDPNFDVGPFIDAATALTDYVVTQDTASVLTTALLLQIETYLAAHFYEHLDPQYTEKVTGDAEGKFQGEWGKNFESSKWGQTAMTLDVTGTLAALSKGRIAASVIWLGKPVSEQIEYQNRD